MKRFRLGQIQCDGGTFTVDATPVNVEAITNWRDLYVAVADPDRDREDVSFQLISALDDLAVDGDGGSVNGIETISITGGVGTSLIETVRGPFLTINTDSGSLTSGGDGVWDVWIILK